jgi:outer membrane protein assembly factor BamB
MKISVPIIIVLVQLFQVSTFAQTDTQWRGQNRTGHFQNENLLKSWPSVGPDLLLHVDDLPGSFSSVVVQDGVMYTAGTSGKEEILTAIDPDGTILWSTAYGDAWNRTFSYARCTPTIEGHYAYMISGLGDLACIDIRDGKLWWSVDGYSQYRGRHGTWGVAESPLIVDDKMIYTPCGDQTTMVAVDIKNGSSIWISESIGDQSSYASPMLMEYKGYKLILTITGNYVICVNAEDGEIFWKMKYSTLGRSSNDAVIHPVTPVAVGNEIFITSGYNHIGIMLQLGEDPRTVSVKWRSKDLDVHHGGVVVHEGFIYGANFTTIRNGNWVCLDWNTGRLQYEQEWKAKGSIILSDGMLICYEEKRGNLALVEATPEGFNIKSQFRIEHGVGPHWAHPSIYNGKMYIRHGKTIQVYQVGR